MVSASKAIKIQSLPSVLIVHLMRFSYGASGSGKLNKAIKYSNSLTIGRELLATSTGSATEVCSACHASAILLSLQGSIIPFKGYIFMDNSSCAIII